MEIIKQLTLVMGEVGAVAKTQRNTHQSFNFRGIDNVVNAVSPALRKHGVVVVPTVNASEAETIEIGQNRTRMGYVRVNVTYTFYAQDGSNIASTVVAESMDSGDKATAKAMSVAFRTALLQTLCLPTDEADPDADTYVRSDGAPKPQSNPSPLVVVNSTGKPAPQWQTAETSAPAKVVPAKVPAKDKPQASDRNPISDSQKSFITKLSAKAELGIDDIVDIAGKKPDDMNSAEASAFIADLLALSKETASIEFGDDSRPRIVHK
jgi:hypothetical protein